MMDFAGRWRSGDIVKPLAILVVLAAALLRFWNLGARLPYGIGIDEPQIVDRAVIMLQTGSFHPHFFDYPGLYIYVQFFVALARFLTGAAGGEFAGLSSFDSIDLYPWARAFTAFLGTLTVAVTFFVGRRFGRWEALAAAAMLAVLPSHVRESHFALTDTPLTLFVALAWLTTLRAHEATSVRTFALSGAMVGFAAATKYNGAIFVLLPLAGVWLSDGAIRFKLRATAAVVGAAAAAFLVGAPYTVLDLPHFLDRFATLNRDYFLSRGPKLPWQIYLKHLRQGFGWPAFLLGAAGIVLALVRTARGPQRVVWLLPLLIVVPHFWLISSRTLVYARYLLPMMPALAVLAGVSFVRGMSVVASRMPQRAVAPATSIAAVVVLAIPLQSAIQFDTLLGAPNTAEQTYTWLRTNVALATNLVIEGGALRTPRGMYTVTEVKRLTDRPMDTYRAARVKYLVSASTCFANQDGQVKPEYGEYFVQAREVFASVPTKQMDGPEIRVYALEP
jgi:4-amino-4-deoxy-L-arabinose transferase-like glycosyltransferase